MYATSNITDVEKSHPEDQLRFWEMILHQLVPVCFIMVFLLLTTMLAHNMLAVIHSA